MPALTSHTSLVPGEASKAANRFFFQPKLTINEPDDIYEQEADAVADKIMRMTDNNAAQNNFFKPSVPLLQRTCTDCEEEEKKLKRKIKGHADVQMKTDPFLIQRQEANETTTTPANGEGETPPSSSQDFLLTPPSSLQPPGTPNFLSMRQPFLNRGVAGSWDPNAALRVWNYNFNFFQGLGISPTLSTTLSNFTAPRSIDAQLRLSNPTWWEVTDRELNTSTIGGSIPLLEFNADFSPTAPSWLRSILGGGDSGVRRKCADCEKEKKMQRKETKDQETRVDYSLENYVGNIAAAGNPLADNVRAFYEPRFGYDFSNVKIHTDPVAAKSAQSINALAYTSGNNIVFNHGQYSPGTESGKKLLAHELTHVAQQQAMPQLVSRAVTPSPVHYRSFNDMMRMEVPAFLAYIQSQADWFSDPALTDDQRTRVRNLLLFINDDVAAYFTYVGMWYFNALLNDVSGALSDERANALRSYASAASARHVPFPVSSAHVSVTTAIARGKEMVRLRQSFDDYILHDAMDETQFLRLMNHAGFVDDVLLYHDTAQQTPIFQAEAGTDFQSFISYNQETARRPLRYESTLLLNKIRNFHRFEKTALDRLVTNYGDHSHVKPLTLILHSALDHNGAFHRDEFLTAIITRNSMLTLMVEGFEQLSDYQAQIGAIANGYGQQHGAHFLIDQVMFAGHGNAQSMQLAGSIHQDPLHPGHIEEVGQDLDVRPGHDAATRSLLQDLLTFMANPANGTGGMSPHNRVVFNACLTGSNSVSTAVNSGNAAVASTEIQTFINTNPSLSTFLQNMANPTVRSIGANASFGQISLINSAGELDIISAGDPAITADKLTYAEKGTEATGTLRAALESWAHDQGATLAAMQRRAALSATGWDAKLIKKAYQIILDPATGYRTNGEGFRLVVEAVDRMAEMKHESAAQVSNPAFSFFQSLPPLGNTTDASALLNTLTTTSEWSNNATRLALLQVWMILDTTKQNDFMTRLGSLTCNFSVRFVDVAFLAGQSPTSLMRVLLAGAASDGAKFRLALIGILGNNNDPDARSYLLGLLAGTVNFPAALNLTSALGGASTQNAILTKLNVFSAPATSQTANVHIGSAGTNTVFVERLNLPGEVSNPFGDHVRDEPDIASPILTTLNYRDPVEIVGRTGDWYAIQFTSGASTVPRAAFISRFSVDTLNPYTY